MLLRVIKGTRPLDWGLFVVLLSLSLSGMFFTKTLYPSGNWVLIEVEGKLLYRLSIFEEKTISIKGPMGYTTVEIKDGRVRVKDSPCPEKICVRQGWIQKGVIICLPNRVVIRVGGEDNRVDAITG